ncbi:MAG: hypothetical protein EZS28_007197 [Streblomastix strix]|uniref:Uncharacterized protein n=1 Tax=Streblomastix strix TaxID=222440 RepID=A0A5J4WT45_9EUKA|nr:MAG: hypothetical protein EZS28_007197 [Streblomastix strix]
MKKKHTIDENLKQKEAKAQIGNQVEMRQIEISSKTVWQAIIPSINYSKNKNACAFIIQKRSSCCNRFDVREQDFDDNVATPDNVVVFDKKKNVIYSIDDYTTAVGFNDKDHKYKRNLKKQYYLNVDDDE